MLIVRVRRCHRCADSISSAQMLSVRMGGEEVNYIRGQDDWEAMILKRLQAVWKRKEVSVLREGKLQTVGLWVGVVVAVLLIVNLIWVFGQQSGDAKRFASETFGNSNQKLNFTRDFYCWPSSDEKERFHRITIGYGDRKVLHAEAFLSGFNVWDRFASLTTVDQVRAEANIVSITGNQVVVELVYAFSSSLEKPRFSTEACIGWTVLAITVPQ